MFLRTFGGLELADLSFTRPKPLLLLAYLALEGPQDRRHVAELFWPEAADHMKSLAVALVQLRQGAAGAIEADHHRCWVSLQTDAQNFLTKLDRGELGEALHNYSAPFLRGFHLPELGVELEEWVLKTREYLAGRARQAMLTLAEQEAAKGQFEQAAKRAEAAYTLSGAAEPEIEDLSRLYPLLLAGESPYAAETRKELESLGREVKLPASLEEARSRYGRSAAKALKSVLPTRNTLFVGRKSERTQLREWLSNPDQRLISLVGPAGVGKTRLALRVAQESDDAHSFSGGLYFVDLEALDDAGRLMAHIAEALKVEVGTQKVLQALADAIAEANTLLVLDNFEHLIDGAVQLGDLLRMCPKLKIIATTRERLGLEEEQLFPISGLRYPHDEAVLLEEAERFHAVQLLLDRVRRVRSDFELSEADLSAVVQICRMVDGLPLGLELAAAWVRLMSLGEIAEELSRNLDLLTSSAKNIPQRHRSVRAAFEYSWKLLNSKEQDVLRKLSVFRGGFRREAASEVAGATIPVLASLVDKSFLRVDQVGRYHRHPLVYEFSREKLTEHPELQNQTTARHASYFLHLLSTAQTDLDSRRQAETLGQIGEELENIRLAWFWAVQHQEHQKLDQAVESLFNFYRVRSYFQEGLELFDETIHTLPRLSQPQNLLAKLYLCSAHFNLELGDYPTATRQAQHGLALTNDEREKAFALETLGKSGHHMGQRQASENCFRESIAILRKLSNPIGTAFALIGFSDMLSSFADFEEGRDVAREALAISRATGRADLVSLSLGALAWPTCCLGDYAEAEQYYQEGLGLSQTLEDRNGIGRGLNFLGWVAWCRGGAGLARAIHYHQQALALYRAIHKRTYIAMCLGDLALALAEAGHYQEAMECGLEGLATAKGIGHFDLVPYTLYCVGAAALGSGDFEKSRHYLSEAITASHSQDQTASALYYFTKLLIAESKQQETKLKAVRVLSCLLSHKACWQAIKDRAAVLMKELESELPAAEFARAKAEGQGQEIEGVTQEVLRST